MLKTGRFWTAAILLAAAAILSISNRRPPANTIKSYNQSPTAETSAVGFETSENMKSDCTENSADETETECSENVKTIREDASQPYISEGKIAEIKGKMDNLKDICSDLTAWIYIADSDIDYPVVQGTDNQYYLHYSPNKRPNQNGSIFLDYRCKRDFSDRQNILFGHNMQQGMFGDIRFFKEKENFEKHRYGWLFTENSLYRIDFYALVIVSAYDSIYDIPAADSAEWQESVRKNSIHYTETEISEDDCFVCLSTCASDFDDARALFIGKMVLTETLV